MLPDRQAASDPAGDDGAGERLIVDASDALGMQPRQIGTKSAPMRLRRQHERPGGLHRACWRSSRSLALLTVEYAAASDVLLGSSSNVHGEHEASIQAVPAATNELTHDDASVGPTARGSATRQPLAGLIRAPCMPMAHDADVARQRHRWPDLPAPRRKMRMPRVPVTSVAAIMTAVRHDRLAGDVNGSTITWEPAPA